MMDDLAKYALAVAREAQQVISEGRRPPEEGSVPKGEQVLLSSVVRGSRGYIEKIVNQINGSYEYGWFDASAVMIRRLIETLIIEVFESHGIADRIKNDHGDYYYLSDLIQKMLEETTWNLGRNTKKALPKFKTIGDLSAHSRRFVAHRGDIEPIIADLRIVVQELVFLAKLK
jgi:hypothetical protein